MKHSSWAALALLCVVASTTVVSAADKVLVIEGQEAFDAAVAENANLVVEFYAPWCGHCKKLAPEFEAAAAALEGEGITLASVDATTDANKELAASFEVRGYPTLKVFRNNNAKNPEEYNGPREADGIVSALKKTFGPVSTLIGDTAAYDVLVNSGLAVVGVFSDVESTAAKLYMQAADALRDEADFGHATDKSLVGACADRDCTDKIVLLKNFDEAVMVYDGESTLEGITSWLTTSSTPVLPELDQKPANRKALQKVFANDLPKLLGMAAADAADLDAFKAELRKVSEATDDVSFIFAEAGENEGALGYFGITAADTPALVIHDAKTNSKYVKTGATAADVAGFTKDFLAGALEKSIKSEDVPEDNSGPVFTLVAKHFEEVVFGGKDVLIEFYAPWCGHCKKLTPIFEEVGAEFAGNDKVIIAKMDATANDVPSDKFDVKGFPTLYFVDGVSGKVSAYDGDRTKEGLVKFVRETGTLAGPAPAVEDAAVDTEEPAKEHDEL